ncbi:MAG: VWA domain-containing protein [Saprospiraceae bacterium]
MFRFEHPYYLFALILIPVLVLIQWWVNKNRLNKLHKFASEGLWSSLIPSFDPLYYKRRYLLWISGITLLIISLSNPQWGIRKEKIEIKSTDIYIALDISNSMMANDIKPSRLERSKLWAESLVRSLSGDRVGTVLFAGQAYLQSPLTTDYGSVTMFVRSAHPELISFQGTNVSDAIIACMENFPKNEEAQRVIFVISDGEDNDENSIETARKAAQNNIIIYTIGAGTEGGGPIPIKSNNNLEDYKRDETGKPVQTKLNASFLMQLAEVTKGKYFHIENGESIIATIKSDIAAMTKQRIAERSYSEYESYFPFLLFPALLLLMIEYLYSVKWFHFLFDRFMKKVK